MNWLKLLKSNSGKLAKGPLIGGAVTLAGMGLTLGGYQHDVSKYDTPDRSVVSLRNVQDNEAVSRLERADNGELTSMPGYLQGRGGTNGVRLAKPEEFGGRLNMDGFDAGLAARFDQTGSLSAGGADGDTGRISGAERVNPAMVRGAGQNLGASPDSYASSQGRGNPRGGQGNTLTNASMARASGSGFSGTSGGSSYTGGNGGTTRGGNPTSGGGDYQFSSSMPDSSSAMALASAHTGGRASFGGDRNFSQRRGAKLRNRGGSLKDIADMSADLAKHGTDGGANAGAKAFLNGNAIGGGVTFSDAPVGGGNSGSSDFNSVTTSGINDNLNQWQEEQQDDLDKERKARKKLAIEILAFLALAAGLGVLMYNLLYNGKHKITVEAPALEAQAKTLRAQAAASSCSYATAMILIKQATALEAKAMALRAAGKALITKGWVAFGAAGAAAAFLVQQSIQFGNNFQWGAVPIMGLITSAGAMGGLTYVAIRALADAAPGVDAAATLKAKVTTYVATQAPKAAGALAKGAAMKGVSELGGQMFK